MGYGLPIAALLISGLAAGVAGEYLAPVTVIAHSPARNEAGVQLDTPIRVQFSGDVDPSTVEGRITLAYAAEDSKERGEPEPPAIAYEIEYVAKDRTLVIRPVDGWLRFREVHFRLGPGARGTDGAPVEPFVLIFMTGG